LRDSSDSELSRERWQQRVDEARRRAEEFVARARNGDAMMPSPPNQQQIEAVDRAMHDPTLQQGDLVATKEGLLLFTGRDERHQPSDFIFAANPSR
jgi:hypothetical protein